MSTALLVIDVQESFRARDSWSTFTDQHITDRVATLVDAARAAGAPVYWILHAEPGSGGAFDPAGGHVRLMGELAPRPDEPVVTKTSVNAFTTTNLQQRLVLDGVTRVAVCGIRTDQCCETTARVAADLGYPVVFAIDATTTSPAGELSAAQVAARTAAVLRERGFADVRTVAEIVDGALLA